MSYSSVFTALITHFSHDKIDYNALSLLIDYQIESKVSGIVISGSTGEALSLSDSEHLELVNYVTSYVKDTKKSNMKVVVGIYASSIKDILHKVSC